MTLWNTDNSNFESTNVLLFLHRWRRPLIFVSAFAIIASMIFSSPYFITPKYKSSVILFPAATNAISKALLTENSGSSKDILDFGDEQETEQLLQILHSNRIRDKIIDKYKLMEHYSINANSNFSVTSLYREYENNISFKRTEFMAVKITVLDRDPQIAANIANDIADLLDSTKNEMQKQRANRAYEIVRDQYFKLRDEITKMEDSLTVLRAFGVHDYESQAEMINQQLAIELANGNKAGINRLEQKLEILAKFGGPYVSLRDALEHMRKQVSLLRAKYEEAKTDAEEVLPSKFIVNSAYKAERKAYPIRWLIVVVTTLSALLFTFIFLLIIENTNAFFRENTNINFQRSKPVERVNETNGKDPPISPRESPQNVVHDRIEEIFPVKPPETDKSKILQNPEQKIEEQKKTEQQKVKSEQTINERQTTQDTTETSDNQMARYFTNTNLLKLLIKWKLHLSAIVLLAIILAVIFSSPWFITPKFKSYALVYPTNITNYSEESQSEQLLQWFKSRAIMEQVISVFNLSKRYNIDKNSKYFRTEIENIYHENILISKTSYEAILIEALDPDPVVACNMVDSIIVFMNRLVLEKHAQKYRESLDLMKSRLMLKEAEMDSVAARLYELRTVYGIVDYPNQSREVARGYLRTVDGNNSGHINTKEVLQLKQNIEQKGGEWTKYNDRYFDLIAEYGAYKVDYEWALLNVEKKITYTTVITNPVPSDKKTKPVRWVIVALTALGAWFSSFLVVLVIENFDSIKRNF